MVATKNSWDKIFIRHLTVQYLKAPKTVLDYWLKKSRGIGILLNTLSA